LPPGARRPGPSHLRSSAPEREHSTPRTRQRGAAVGCPALARASLELADLGGLRALLALRLLELHALTFDELAVAGAIDRREVDEDVGRTVVRRDEPVPLRCVEPLHRALGHCRTSPPPRPTLAGDTKVNRQPPHAFLNPRTAGRW